MKLRKSLWLAGLALALVLPASAPAQQQDLTKLPPVQNGYKPKTTAWGEPDLNGGWPIDSLNGRTPLQRDAKYGNRQLLNDTEFAERNAMDQQLEHQPGGRPPSCLYRRRQTALHRHAFDLAAQPGLRLDQRLRQLGPLRH